MRPFTYEQDTTAAEAARAVAHGPNAMFLAGGTTLVDLMKIDVLTPDTVIHVGQLALAEVEVGDEGVRIGAS
jgi:xanthine dehydrogenase YagS FAD-binding subunit